LAKQKQYQACCRQADMPRGRTVAWG